MTAAEPHERSHVARDPSRLRALAGAYRLSQAIAAAAKLGVGDALAAGPLDSTAVAAATGAHPPALRRLLRALAGEGVLTEGADRRFSLSELGQCLRSDDPDGTREMILGWSCLQEGYLAFAHLHETVMTGRSGFELAFGRSFHEYTEQHPDVAAAYGKATDSTVAGFEEAIASYDFSGVRTVVDVGGGGGTLLTALLRAYPTIRGVLLERATVIERVRVPEDVADRIECVAGNALEAVPAGADAYLLSTVLRCFDDDGCTRILRACRRAMPAHAKLLALEMLLHSAPLPPSAGLADLQALIVYGGADRDQRAWSELTDRAGLKLRRVQPADAPYWWLIFAPEQPSRSNGET